MPHMTPARCHICPEFVVGSRLASRVFLLVLRFSSLLKNQHFQIPIRIEDSHENQPRLMWLPLPIESLRFTKDRTTPSQALEKTCLLCNSEAITITIELSNVPPDDKETKVVILLHICFVSISLIKESLTESSALYCWILSGVSFKGV